MSKNLEKVVCANCGWTGDANDVREIRHFWERVNAGDEMPSGECPKCECLCFPSEEADPPKNIVVIVEGGIVQDVFTDASSVYTVVDHDSEDVKGPHIGSFATHPICELDADLQKQLGEIVTTDRFREVKLWTIDSDTDADGCQVNIFTTKAELEQWQWNLLNDTAKDDEKLGEMIRCGNYLDECWQHFLDNPPNHLDSYNIDEHTIKVPL